MRDGIHPRLASVLLATSLLLGACTSTNDGAAPTIAADSSTTPVTNTASTSADPTTSATTTPPDTTVRPAGSTTTAPDPLAASALARYGAFGPDHPLGATTGPYSGSGCTVAGDQIPDGVWFGHILEYVVLEQGGPAAFDLACVERSGGQNIVYNEIPSIRDISLTDGTRFVFVHDQVVLTPNAHASQISRRLAEHHDVGWGWALIEEGTLAEFYIPASWDWQNRTNHDRESTIPSLLHPDPTSDEVLTAEDGFDGSGCTPQGASLPDGLWFGRAGFIAPDQVSLDLWCSISDVEQMIEVGIDPDFVEDRTFIVDGDDTEYELAIERDALLFMTFIDGNVFQTPLALDDPRYLHWVSAPEQLFEPWTPGLWVRVEEGVIVEGYNFFSA